MNVLAIVTVVFSSFAIAFLTIRKEIIHCKHLNMILNLISAIKNKAMFYNIPFAEIVMQLQNEDAFRSYSLLYLFMQEMKSGMTVPEAWKNANIHSDLVLEDHERNILTQFGKDMCNCSRDQIQGISDRAICELIELRNSADEKRKVRSKSTAAVIISVGLMIVLVFV